MLLRDEIVNTVKREIEGPSLGHDEESEVLGETPLVKYITAVLEPCQEEKDPAGELDDVVDEEDEDIDEESIVKISNATTVSQSSFGFSFFIAKDYTAPLVVKVQYGTYTKLNDGSFLRKQHVHEEMIAPNTFNRRNPYKKKLHDEKLCISIYERDVINKFFDFSGKRLLTLSVMNLLRKKAEERGSYEDCFFQVEMSVSTGANEPFLPFPEYVSNFSEDDTNNQLLYRDVRNYANGHGCSVIWKTTPSGSVYTLTSSFMPTYELFPLNHRDINGLDLEMLNFFNDEDGRYAEETFSKLLQQYQEWIDKNEKKVSTIDVPILQEQARKNIESCRVSLGRMRKGVDLLRQPNVRTAFRYMNWAMLFQQVRYSMEERLWQWDGKHLTIEEEQLPLPGKPETWPDYDPLLKRNKKLGKWRPFQVAFVLMNLQALEDPHSEDRETVDLIWFPTGGGKTEAYLGLTAFTILYNRLTGVKAQGTEVIMRYTLRLLTTEQFQRAASLICACELLRQQEKALGTAPITIGLWVGGDVTPNRSNQAVKAYDKMVEANGPYKFILLKCPCCGKRMGKINKGGGGYGIRGIKMENEIIEFTCYGDCEFNNQKLPVEVVDDYIYEKPCTLVIATVDKFAQLPWEPRSRKILGVDFPREGNYNPPSLIIQDELHLISGPLGSLVGLYETLLEYLMTGGANERSIKPKIVASTATIALAKDQIKALYARDTSKINIFPTPCIDHNDNFFAFLDNTGNGRKYVGIYANSSPSFKTTQVRVMSILLQAPHLLKEQYGNDIDPYHTLVTYFNRTQDLAYAVTFCNDDIEKRLKELYYQYKIPMDTRRYLNKYQELTSREKNEKIPEIRQNLAIPYPDRKALDVCLATNMISVGIDIPRLSLMCMVAQPKSTAEYIQASSRVGRDKAKPGLVFMVYNARRSRDRSHFEKFLAYHQKVYCFVEASGVTPFSLPAVERGLAGVIVGMLRLKEKIGGDVSSIRYPSNAVIEKIKNFLLDRCQFIDPLEVDRMEKFFDELMGRWENLNPSFYGDYFPNYTGPAPLMLPYSAEGTIKWKPTPWRVLESLRNVDKEIVLEQFQSFNND